MNRQRFLQDLTILLLSLAAAGLLVIMGAIELGGSDRLGQLGQFLSGDQLLPARTGDLTERDTPLNLVLTSSRGRRGELLTSTLSDTALQCASLIREAAGSSTAGEIVPARSLRQALGQQGVFIDFLHPLPAQAAAGCFGAELTDSQPIRCLLLSAGAGDTCSLLLWDGGSQVRRWSTAVPVSALLDLLVGQEPNGATFAFEAGEDYAGLYPYTLLPAQRVSAQVLAASTPAEATSDGRLLGALGFNTHTNYRYPEIDGTQVIVESPRTLRIRPDGVVLYTSDEDTAGPLMTIPLGKDETPTAVQAALLSLQLAETLLPPSLSGDSRFFLSGVEGTAEGWRISLGVHVNGLPIYYADGTSAMEITFTGAAVTAFSLRCRRYALTADSFTLLPLAQAAAVASGPEGAMLTTGYVDRGGDTASPEWLLQ